MDPKLTLQTDDFAYRRLANVLSDLAAFYQSSGKKDVTMQDVQYESL